MLMKSKIYSKRHNFQKIFNIIVLTRKGVDTMTGIAWVFMLVAWSIIIVAAVLALKTILKNQ